MWGKEIINCTPHEVVLILPDGDTITWAPSGIIPRLPFTEEKVESIDSPLGAIDIKKKVFEDPTDLPAPHGGKLYIVSALVAGACPNRGDLIIPNNTVRDEQGRIIGCRSFAVI